MFKYDKTMIELFDCQVCGFIHFYSKNNDFPTDLIDLIYKYCVDFKNNTSYNNNNQYISISIDKNDNAMNTKLKKCSKKIKMPTSRQYKFNPNFCPNCRRYGHEQYGQNGDLNNSKLKTINILEYKASYYDKNRWNEWSKNNVNEYQCRKCQYYISLNIKNDKSYPDDHTVLKTTPFATKKKYKNLDTNIDLKKKDNYSKSGSIKCNQCKDSTLYLTSNSDSTVIGATAKSKSTTLCYCVNCCLFYDEEYYSSG